MFLLGVTSIIGFEKSITFAFGLILLNNFIFYLNWSFVKSWLVGLFPSKREVLLPFGDKLTKIWQFFINFVSINF